jgi:hypothetical protein
MIFYPLLGRFTKLRKAVVSFVVYICLSAHMVQLGSHGTDFHESLNLFENLSRKFKFLYSITRITGAVHKDQYIFLIIFLSIPFLEWKMFQTKVVEKIKPHILCSVTFSDDRAHLWDNMTKCGRARRTTDGYKAHALWMVDIYGYGHTLRVFKTYCFSKQWLHEHVSILRLYLHCLSCLSYLRYRDLFVFLLVSLSLMAS